MFSLLAQATAAERLLLDLAEGGTGRVRIAIRTPPNISRRDVKGFPIQLVGIAVQRIPPRLLDPMFGVLRRATIPDLSAKGLPRPSAR